MTEPIGASRAAVRWAAIAVGAALLIAVALAAAWSANRNDGHFVYALDDTYIHMAVARHLSDDGVWGIDGSGFTSCSSSPLWTLLLAGAGLAGAPRHAVPFVLATLCALGVVAVSAWVLARERLSTGFVLGILLLAAAAAPLPVLAFVGNEHALHTMLTIALAAASVHVLSLEEPRKAQGIPLAVLAALLTASRYEGLFLVAILAVLFVIRRRFVHAGALVTGGAAPVLAFGIVSVMHGGFFLPNSVLLKTKYPLLDLPGRLLAFSGPSVIVECLRTPELAVLLAGAIALLIARLRRRGMRWEAPTLLLAVFVALCLAHMDFARTGEFYRYEAYLVALGVLASGIALADVLTWRRVAARSLAPAVLLAAVVVVPLAWRAVDSYRELPLATGNIYQQQFQMARFVAEYYSGEPVAANDIGAINELARIRCVDLWGLADMEVARARRDGSYGPRTMRQVAHAKRVGMAVVYDPWFERFGGLPREWVRIGQWTIDRNVVCGFSTVSFYATSEPAQLRLLLSLRRFSARLPRQVRQSGAYVEGL